MLGFGIIDGAGWNDGESVVARLSIETPPGAPVNESAKVGRIITAKICRVEAI
jgi:hypothetical protein